MKKLLSILLSLALCQTAMAQTSFKGLVGDTQVAPVQEGVTQVPFITWGGDVATFHANGGLETKPESIFGQAGLKLKLVPGDDFVQQVRDYMSGKSPYLRGTIRMCGMASEVLNSDPRTKPVTILQLTFSQGDHMVAREDIKTLNDLNGKKICLQQGGPHLGLVDDALAAARLTWDDVEVEWAADLTASDGSPAEKFRSDPSIAACCVISPDMIGLTGGLEQKGTGAEGTVKGAHVVVSTAQMNRSIVDVYQCRKDYFDANKAEVEKFVVGYLKATEELMVAKKAYSDGQGQSPVYVNALKLTQQIYGPEVLPTIEIDAHGLVLDANFVRIPGNEAFFNDPNNLVGFQAKQDSALALAVKLGYSTQKMGFEPANWDYKKISKLVGVKYVAPVYASGRIKAEVTDFGDDLEDDTIFTFEIKFEPEQIDFPVATYAADFQRFAKASATFGNAAIIIEGHADPTLAIQQFFWAAKAKGLITGTNGSYRFKGQPLDLTNTDAIVQAIQMENLAGQQRRNRSGQIEEIPNPKRTVAAALTLSKSRAEAVKAAIEDYAQQNNLSIDLSQALAHGVGVADPVNPKPSSMAEAKENMRVVFRVVRVAAEALSEDDFNFDE